MEMAGSIKKRIKLKKTVWKYLFYIIL